MKDLAAIVLPQLDALIAMHDALKKRSKYEDCSDTPLDETSRFITAGLDAIHRIAGSNSQYAVQISEVVNKVSPYHLTDAIHHMGGALVALRQSVDSGYLIPVRELIHADLFSDFLEMAEHLLSEGYKDAAAVLVGSMLEEHLRKLCTKNGVSREFADSKSDLLAKKAETMNTELASSNIYSKLDQKNVTAWLDLRNKAAHGRYGEYTADQVELMLQAVRNFIARLPA